MKTYKVGQRIKYYDDSNRIESGTIVRIVDGTLYVNSGYGHPEWIKPEDVICKSYDRIRNTIIVILSCVAVVWLLTSIVTNAPPIPQVDKYTECMDKIGMIYDTLNDTVGASVFNGDTPTGNLTNLLDHCMANL